MEQNERSDKGTPNGTTLKELLDEAEPLFNAFQTGNIRSSDLKNILNEMELQDMFEPLMVSPSDFSMRTKAREMLTSWYQAKGKFIASTEALCEILRKVGLTSHAIDIQEERTRQKGMDLIYNITELTLFPTARISELKGMVL